MGVPGFLGSQHVSAKFILKHYGLDPDKDMVYRIVDSGTRIRCHVVGRHRQLHDGLWGSA